MTLLNTETCLSPLHKIYLLVKSNDKSVTSPVIKNQKKNLITIIKHVHLLLILLLIDSSQFYLYCHILSGMIFCNIISCYKSNLHTTIQHPVFKLNIQTRVSNVLIYCHRHVISEAINYSSLMTRHHGYPWNARPGKNKNVNEQDN